MKKKKKAVQKASAKKKIPFEFVLESLQNLRPYTRPMFGCTAVYIEDRIMFILRDKETELQDNGVWLATAYEHHASLKKILPNMRSIRLLANGNETAWQNLPADSDDFEEAVIRVCELILQGDVRIGKVPARRKKKKIKTKQKSP